MVKDHSQKESNPVYTTSLSKRLYNKILKSHGTHAMGFKIHDKNRKEMPSYFIPKRLYHEGDHKSRITDVGGSQPAEGTTKALQSKCGNHYPPLELIDGYQKPSDDQYVESNDNILQSIRYIIMNQGNKRAI
ncbi:hypothetical protein FG05_35051 [Fusarium graminearum]|nr:hypothetical protein FG05_35051 [Fusarium graminearum]